MLEAIETPFERRLREARIGDRILVCDTPSTPHGVVVHPRGLLLKQDDTAWRLNNALAVRFREPPTAWKVHPQGIVAQYGSELWLNDSQQLYGGNLETWAVHPDGAAVVKKRTSTRYDVLLNGTQPLAVLGGRPDTIFCTDEGALVTKYSFALVINSDSILENHSRWSHNFSVKPHPRGYAVVSREGYFVNGTVIGKEDEPGHRLISAEQLDSPESLHWYPHRLGLMVERSNSIHLLRSETEDQAIYDGPFEWWHPHPRGLYFMVGADGTSKRSLYLSVLFPSEEDERAQQAPFDSDGIDAA